MHGMRLPAACSILCGLVAPARCQPILEGASRWGDIVRAVVGLEEVHDRSAWIAAFDVDGTLVREKPRYAEVDWATAALCNGSAPPPAAPPRVAGLCDGTTSHEDLAYPEEVYDLLLAPFAGWPVGAYHAAAACWLRSRRDLVYAPVLDLVNLLSGRGWRVLLVSQTMVDTLRALVAAYGLRVAAVLGTAPEVRAAPGPALRRGARLHAPLMTGGEKLQAIWASEGGLPLAAFGNAAGDLAMLQGASLGVVVDHTSSAECPECEYPLWSSDHSLRRNVSVYGWHVVTIDDLPRPLFQRTGADQCDR